jgi:chromosome segregation ATPase
MTSTVFSWGAAALVLALAGTFATPCADAADQPKGRIVCWKDKSGKIVGCGDKVPPEYQDAATREMDRSGVTRGATESAADAAKRREQERAAANAKAEEAKRAAEQKRQDSALLNTYSNEKEIDQRRDRDLQQVDIQLGQMKTTLKTTTDRFNEVNGRADAAAKGKGGVSAGLKDELERATADKQRAEQNLAMKEKEKEEITKRYAEQKKRYLELRGDAAPAKQAGK